MKFVYLIQMCIFATTCFALCRAIKLQHLRNLSAWHKAACCTLQVRP